MRKIKERTWLLVTVSTAGAPAALRVTVWRKLKELGALYLQQSACLLPQLPATSRAISQLSTRIMRDGGTVRVLTMAFSDPAQEQDIIRELQTARKDEYAEVLERFPSFFAELGMETARGRTTFEEVEESEADLARFRSWISKIRARDYFQAPLGDQARTELIRAEEAMTLFAEAAMLTDHVITDEADDAPGTVPRLRSV
ncbi:Chromate resistance protein ChrB [Arthrobacter sp. CG_A4]|uniref:Chromate resistance protein ChrB n=1 Tax=Arthrobacter sp. CG_A4 TaxID=3071706 RepID=UPI002DF90F3B|nr:ribosomal protein S28E/S33 [Arthrobacter sp. CG_A4]